MTRATRATSRRRAFAGFAVALLVPTSARAQPDARRVNDAPAGETYHIEVAAGCWRPHPIIVLASDGRGIRGTRIDFMHDLGMTARGFPELQIILRPVTRHKVRFQWIRITYDSTATLPHDETFNGISYPQGASVISRLDWRAYRLGYEYDFVVKSRGFAGFIIEAKQTDVRAQLTSARADEVARTRVPIPAIGAVGRVYLGARLSLTGELTGLKVPDNPSQTYGGHYAELDLYGTLNVTNRVGAQIGYRSLDIDHFGESNSGTLALRGVYVGAVVRY